MVLKVQSRIDMADVDPIRIEQKVSARETATQDVKPQEKKTNLEKIVDQVEVESAVDSINGAIEYVHRGLRFVVHEDTNRMMVRVVDILTDEVIKEIPPEEVLDTAARIREMIGILIDERA